MKEMTHEQLMRANFFIKTSASKKLHAS